MEISHTKSLAFVVFDGLAREEAALHDIFVWGSAMGWYTSRNAGFAGFPAE
jgi:hypothetical protein